MAAGYWAAQEADNDYLYALNFDEGPARADSLRLAGFLIKSFGCRTRDLTADDAEPQDRFSAGWQAGARYYAERPTGRAAQTDE